MSQVADAAGDLPVVDVVIGPAGSGKSAVSREIATRSVAAYLDKDSLAKEFVEALLAGAGHDPRDRDNNPWYTEQVMPLEYAALLRVAGDNLRLGRSVVLDAPFGAYLDQPDFLVRQAATHGWPPALWRVVHVVTDGETVRRRVVERGYSRDSWKLAHWDEFWTGASGRECSWHGAEHVVVDNSGDHPDLAALGLAAGV
ncbi:AAA family ATPase [Nocardioides sp. GY 10127]|uniref:AAA family ATPase n=1 Tax=Nocardioides sp. GY 10127 TaxID=2569762 RepID=UPI0010A7A177|nr:AAA family ATPase [Nocardioides sp. GY 10127]TIC80186.1 ATP-binding protein [Nocardioides sp. GY 10127]